MAMIGRAFHQRSRIWVPTLRASNYVYRIRYQDCVPWAYSEIHSLPDYPHYDLTQCQAARVDSGIELSWLIEPIPQSISIRDWGLWNPQQPVTLDWTDDYLEFRIDYGLLGYGDWQRLSIPPASPPDVAATEITIERGNLVLTWPDSYPRIVLSDLAEPQTVSDGLRLFYQPGQRVWLRIHAAEDLAQVEELILELPAVPEVNITALLNNSVINFEHSIEWYDTALDPQARQWEFQYRFAEQAWQAHPVTEALTSLQPGQTYEFRYQAANALWDTGWQVLDSISVPWPRHQPARPVLQYQYQGQFVELVINNPEPARQYQYGFGMPQITPLQRLRGPLRAQTVLGRYQGQNGLWSDYAIMELPATPTEPAQQPQGLTLTINRGDLLIRWQPQPDQWECQITVNNSLSLPVQGNSYRIPLSEFNTPIATITLIAYNQLHNPSLPATMSIELPLLPRLPQPYQVHLRNPKPGQLILQWEGPPEVQLCIDGEWQEYKAHRQPLFRIAFQQGRIDTTYGWQAQSLGICYETELLPECLFGTGNDLNPERILWHTERNIIEIQPHNGQWLTTEQLQPYYGELRQGPRRYVFNLRTSTISPGRFSIDPSMAMAQSGAMAGIFNL